ncbi:MAG: hypothetical protein H6839_08050 [Planctomycetes bacterium]|nr:hypothetical protein [Planctomycetota bacterium]
MSTNRIPAQPSNDPQPGDEPVVKVVVVQTPLGLVKLAVPVSGTPGGFDPLQVAMNTFQQAVDSGVADPLMQTLQELKEMSDAGTTEPLVIGLAILKQMSDKNMLPPMNVLIEGTGITPAFVNAALETVTPTGQRGVIDKLDSIYLN